MELREMKFMVCPADAIIVDIMGKQLGVPADEAARFIYQAGLRALYVDGVILREIPNLRQELAGESLNRQLEQTTVESRYRYTGGHLERVTPKATDKELMMMAEAPAAS